MALIRRYSQREGTGAQPQGLDDRLDYDEDRNSAVLRSLTSARSHSLRRPSPMPQSPRSSLSPGSSPRAAPSRRVSGSWTPSEAIMEESSAEDGAQADLTSSWSTQVDSALHNQVDHPLEHDPAGYKCGGYVPQHHVAGQMFNYRRLPSGATIAEVPAAEAAEILKSD